MDDGVAWWGALNEPLHGRKREGGRGGDDGGGHGRGASEPHGRTDRTDGRTPMADCSPISRISRTSTPNRLGGGMATTVAVAEAKAGDREV